MTGTAKSGKARYNKGDRLPGCYPAMREKGATYEPAAR